MVNVPDWKAPGLGMHLWNVIACDETLSTVLHFSQFFIASSGAAIWSFHDLLLKYQTNLC